MPGNPPGEDPRWWVTAAGEACIEQAPPDLPADVTTLLATPPLRHTTDMITSPHLLDPLALESVLEELRRQGVVVRLSERRDGWPVYVLPEHVNGRPIAAISTPLTLADLARRYSRGE